MKPTKQDILEAMKLYLVSDRSWLDGRELQEDIEKSIQGGVTCVQLREKDMVEESFLKEAFLLKKLCKEYHVPFIINDDVTIMLASDADGVHVGQHDMEAGNVRKQIGEDKILGVSVQTVAQALRAEQAGADYLGVGAVFSTNTKTDADDVSLETLCDICNAVAIPVIAIGGITKDTIIKLKECCLDGVAVVSAIMAQKDIKEAANTMLVKVEELLR